jgi:hypothetical protein
MDIYSIPDEHYLSGFERRITMSDPGTISPLTSLVMYAFTAIVVGGMVLYLALTGRKEKK